MFASTNWILLDSCPLLLVHGPPVLLALVILSVQNSMISVMRSSRWYKLYTVLAMTYCFEVLLWIIYIYVHVYEYDLKHCSFGQLPYLGLVCFPPLFLRGTIKIPLFFFLCFHIWFCLIPSQLYHTDPHSIHITSCFCPLGFTEDAWQLP